MTLLQFSRFFLSLFFPTMATISQNLRDPTEDDLELFDNVEFAEVLEIVDNNLIHDDRRLTRNARTGELINAMETHRRVFGLNNDGLRDARLRTVLADATRVFENPRLLLTRDEACGKIFQTFRNYVLSPQWIDNDELDCRSAMLMASLYYLCGGERTPVNINLVKAVTSTMCSLIVIERFKNAIGILGAQNFFHHFDCNNGEVAEENVDVGNIDNDNDNAPAA